MHYTKFLHLKIALLDKNSNYHFNLCADSTCREILMWGVEVEKDVWKNTLKSSASCRRPMLAYHGGNDQSQIWHTSSLRSTQGLLRGLCNTLSKGNSWGCSTCDCHWQSSLKGFNLWWNSHWNNVVYDAFSEGPIHRYFWERMDMLVLLKGSKERRL